MALKITTVDPTETIVDDWNDLFVKIKDARVALGDPATVWFRGQANATHASCHHSIVYRMARSTKS